MIPDGTCFTDSSAILNIHQNKCFIKQWLSRFTRTALKGLSDVYLAAWSGDTATLAQLHKNGANLMKLHSSGFTALHLSAWNMDAVATEFLLHIADVDWISVREHTKGFTALHMASANDDDAMIDKLIENEAVIF